MELLTETSLVIPVHEAAFVQPFRVKNLHRPGASMPPHITVHVPFKPMSAIDAGVLARLTDLCRAHPAFPFSLVGTAPFSDTGVLYLVPEPDEPFLALSRAIQANFPEAPSDHPDPIMHLTLARTEPSELERLTEEFQQGYGHRFPLPAMATDLWLFAKQGNIWLKQATFALAN